jgi:short-subunit dehydrogenase
MKHENPDLVTVITGASSGIARATALKLACEGGTVVLASRQEQALREVARECEAQGGRALVVPTDVTSEEEVQHLVLEAVNNFDRIDAWVNAAAVNMMGRFEKSPGEAFRRVIETNFFGCVHAARAVLPYFRKQQCGVLVNVASVLGKFGSPYESAYVASKFAVTGFSECLRMEVRDMPDVHVCTVFPPTVDTPLFQHAANFTGRVIKAIPPVYRPERAAAVIVSAIHRPRREATVGSAGLMIALRRLAPPLFEAGAATRVEHGHFEKRGTAASLGNLFVPMPLNSVSGGWRRD